MPRNFLGGQRCALDHHIISLGLEEAHNKSYTKPVAYWKKEGVT